MFLGILPKQMHEDQVHLGGLMTIQDMDHHNPAKMLARREKLKCLIAYLKHTVKD